MAVMAMSISPEATRRLRLTTDNAQAEILLIDGSFKVTKRGPSPLEATVPPGVYSMKIKVGDKERESLLLIEPSEVSFEKHLEAPLFDSPIPLNLTSTSHEYHQGLVSRLLQPGPSMVTLGNGSRIMVCVRDPSKENRTAIATDASDQDKETYAGSFKGFRILDAKGNLFIDLDKVAERDLVDGFLALTAEVNQGSYALAYPSSLGWVCSPLPVINGWTLQIYVNVVPTGRGQFQLSPDLSGMAVMLGRTGEGFDASRNGWIASETVRQGLLEGRNYVDTPTMRSMLTEKFEDPMLGLYAAHLLLVESAPNLQLLQEVIGNLGQLLGPLFPDVFALDCELSRLQGADAERATWVKVENSFSKLSGPPVLARSWGLLLAAADRYGVQMSSAGAVFSVAGELVQNGVFVAWSRTSVESRPAPQTTAGSEVVAGDANVVREVVPVYTRDSASGLAAPPSTPPSRVDATAGSLILRFASLALRGLKVLRRVDTEASRPAQVSLADEIAAISSYEQAAAALVTLAKSHDWRKLLPEISKDTRWSSSLSGFQRSLMLLLRDVAGDNIAIEGFTASYVEQMLRAQQVSLPILVDALSALELGGRLTDRVRKFIVRPPKAIAAP